MTSFVFLAYDGINRGRNGLSWVQVLHYLIFLLIIVDVTAVAAFKHPDIILLFKDFFLKKCFFVCSGWQASEQLLENLNGSSVQDTVKMGNIMSFCQLH